jgi:hypothetical protein
MPASVVRTPGMSQRADISITPTPINIPLPAFVSKQTGTRPEFLDKDSDRHSGRTCDFNDGSTTPDGTWSETSFRNAPSALRTEQFCRAADDFGDRQRAKFMQRPCSFALADDGRAGRWRSTPSADEPMSIPPAQLPGATRSAMQLPAGDTHTEGSSDADYLLKVSNLPNNYTPQLLIEELQDAGFQPRRDFSFLHMLVGTTCEDESHLGLFFIKFENRSIMNAFVTAFHNEELRLSATGQTVSVEHSTSKELVEALIQERQELTARIKETQGDATCSNSNVSTCSRSRNTSNASTSSSQCDGLTRVSL